MDLDRRALRLALLVLREDRGWTQEQASRASGVRRASFSDYEAGKAMPARNLGKILAAFEVDPEDFAGLVAALRRFFGGATLRAHQQQGPLAEAVRSAEQGLQTLFETLLAEAEKEP